MWLAASRYTTQQLGTPNPSRVRQTATSFSWKSSSSAGSSSTHGGMKCQTCNLVGEGNSSAATQGTQLAPLNTIKAPTFGLHAGAAPRVARLAIHRLQHVLPAAGGAATLLATRAASPNSSETRQR